MADELTLGRTDLDQLAAKLDALDLSGDERTLLAALFDAARRELAGSEVRGYGPSPHMRSSPFVDVFADLFPVGTRTTLPAPSGPTGSDRGIIING